MIHEPENMMRISLKSHVQSYALLKKFSLQIVTNKFTIDYYIYELQGKVKMSKSIALAIPLIFLPLTASASMKYECSRYVNGEYKGYTTVVADSKSQAEKKAYKKFTNKLGKKVDTVKCK
jgi:hypothetical protein